MSLPVGKPDKVLFPDEGLTKAGLADYYERILPEMLPQLRDRPLTLHRFPDGIDGEGFFQKEASDHFPDWIDRVDVERKQGGRVTHVLVHRSSGAADTLRYLVDQGTIELHVWLARQDEPQQPDRMIFDLDPPDDGFGKAIDGARALRERLSERNLVPFVMTTGSSGLHVVAPLRRSPGFDAVRDLASEVAEELARDHPRQFTTEQRKDKRGGRLYLDIMRNAYAQSGIAPYSVRAKPGAPVAAPLEWDELGRKDIHPQRYGTGNIFRRLAQRTCPWQDIEQHKRTPKGL